MNKITSKGELMKVNLDEYQRRVAKWNQWTTKTGKAMRKVAEKSAIDPCDLALMNLSLSSLELSSEAGEVVSMIKKKSRLLGDRLGEKPLSPQFCKDLALELGDVIWAVTALAELIEMDLNDIIDMNDDKLSARFEDNQEKSERYGMEG